MLKSIPIVLIICLGLSLISSIKSQTCTGYSNLNFRGYELSARMVYQTYDCCDFCFRTQGCQFWTHDTNTNVCKLFYSVDDNTVCFGSEFPKKTYLFKLKF